jgi:FtsH-binding integral membrane protein
MHNHGAMNPSSRQQGITRLVRDVFVNVIANLIAAAVIYLGGVAFGFFPRSTSAIASAVCFVLLAGFYGVFVVSRFMPAENRMGPAFLAAVLGGSAYCLAILTGLYDDPTTPRWMSAAGGGLMAVFGLIGLAMLRVQKKAATEPGQGEQG